MMVEIEETPLPSTDLFALDVTDAVIKASTPNTDHLALYATDAVTEGSTIKPNICKRCCIRISLNNSPSRQYKEHFMSLLNEPVICPEKLELLQDSPLQVPLTPELQSLPCYTCYLCAGILQESCIVLLLEKCKESTSQYKNVERIGVTCSNTDLLSARSYLCGIGKIDLNIRAVFKWILSERLSAILNVPQVIHSDSKPDNRDLMVNIVIRLNDSEFKWTCNPPLNWNVYDLSQGKFKHARLKDALENSSYEEIHQFLTLPGKSIDYTISVEANPTFVGGRYTKLARDISQTPWGQQDGLLISANVEDVICKPLIAAFGADEAKMHAAGREDIDVRMLGDGRPFYVQLNNVRKIPSEEKLEEIQQEINKCNQHVKCYKLTRVTKTECGIVKQGQEEKQKKYRCIVKAENEMTDEMIGKLDGLNDILLKQTTPIRVLHRRTPLTRPRRILKVKARLLTRIEVEECTRNDTLLTESFTNRLFVIDLETEAGTYVKEFVHGDFNRTIPNVGSIIKNRCDILQLDVTNVTMNWPPER